MTYTIDSSGLVEIDKGEGHSKVWRLTFAALPRVRIPLRWLGIGPPSGRFSGVIFAWRS